MFRNYFTAALRNLRKHKTFSLINILGLAIGISASLVIYLIVDYDLSFDKFEKDGNRIYRVVSDYVFSGQVSHSSGVPHAMPAALKNEVTGLEVVAPFRVWNDGAKISVPAENGASSAVYKKQKNLVFADQQYFSLLNYHWLAGSPRGALIEPYQVVLTEAGVESYFPGLHPTQIIGKEIIFNDSIRTTVTGIVKDLAQNTDFSFKIFISRATIELPRLRPGDGDEWGSTNHASQLFVKLAPGTSSEQVEKQIAAVFKKNYSPNGQAVNIITTHRLEPLSDLHFDASYDNFSQRLAHKPTLYGLSGVAVFLLLLACINFINLTTANASKRAKEIGIRKTMGSSRKQLIAWFLGETFLLTATAAVLSICLVPLILKAFADFIPAGLYFSITRQPGLLLFFLLLIPSVGLLAGCYPALILSSYKPAIVLRNRAAAGVAGGVGLRKSLTVFQFTVAQIFIIATILVGKQINYTLYKDLGFKKDVIIYFETNYNDTDPRHKMLLMQKLKTIPEIADVSLSNTPPSTTDGGTRILRYKDGKNEIETEADKNFVDTGFFNLYQIKLLAGSNLSSSDTMRGLVINETFAHLLGFTDLRQAIGRNLEWDKGVQYPVVGVVADFHQRSLHEPIRPMVMSEKASNELMFSVALQPQNENGKVWETAISKIEKAFREVYPKDEFEYNFLDETIRKYYTAEQNISGLLIWATGLAIVISCLGLLGFVIYLTNQRTKEIGIRKVIGATIPGIIYLLSKDILKLIAFAFLIAVPIAWLGSHAWLNNFAYKTKINWWVFAAGGCTMFLIALLVQCFKIFRAATANPVNTLRMD